MTSDYPEAARSHSRTRRPVNTNKYNHYDSEGPDDMKPRFRSDRKHAELASSNSDWPFAAQDPYYDQAYKRTGEYEKPPPSNFERFCCCCCPKKKQHRMICGGVVALVIIGLGILAFFMFPRMPTSSIWNVEQIDFAITYPTPDKNINQMRIQGTFKMDVTSFNPNAYHLLLDKLDVDVHVRANESIVFSKYSTSPLALVVGTQGVAMIGPAPSKDQKPAGYKPSNSSLIGTASYKSLYLPPKSSTNYTMMFSLDYTPDQFVGILEDPTIMEMASACGLSSRPAGIRRPIGLSYNGKSTIGLLSWMGIYPEISNDSGGLYCPFNLTPEIISQLQQDVNNGMSVDEALAVIFH
ncbi:UNVERIFIED_CONTAM: hypothetical protein HDU68_010584 [Siphonaria sp. JEL0065]|nr:hypothetical protein HDU68_010584 [Siphonaria sp. JEL0065]